MPRLKIMRVLAGTVAIALLGSCGGGGNTQPAPLTITADSPPDGTTGTEYSGYTFAATGGTPPLRWSESGTLPPGLALSTSGQVSGTPATAGTYQVSVTVTDSSVPSLRTSASVSVKVADSAIKIAPASPPAGTVSYAYPEFKFSANGGSPPYAWTATGTLPPGLMLSADGALSGTPTQTGTFAFSVIPTDSAQTPVKGPTLAVEVVVTDFRLRVLGTPRSWHTATRLVDGSVLVAGGATGTAIGATATAERYDPAAAAFIPTGLMIYARQAHTATLLMQGQRAGQVLITGGSQGRMALQTAELYNPVSGRFTATGDMLTPRVHHTATLLPSGNVLIAGGADESGRPVSSAELYDPATGAFAATGSMNAPHSEHAAALLASDKVLITGGSGTAAEIYDPASGTFALTGPMLESRVSLTATTLTSGQVLITGGLSSTGFPLSSVEIYDPATGKFASIGTMAAPRARHAAVLRVDGSVLVLGGSSYIHTNSTMCRIFGCPLRVLEPTTSVEVYDPKTRLFARTGALSSGRDSHTATILADGDVLIAGGEVVKVAVYGGMTRCCISYDYLAVTASAELE
jgi:hypothetical protein